MKVLIDGDILIYRTGFASEDTSEGIAKSRLLSSVEKILTDTNSSEYEIYLSDSLEQNFRYKLFPLYKGNRVLSKPTHFQSLSDTLANTFEATIAEGMEADDAIGIEANRLGPDKCVIASIDKDLLQIPGNHYNWVNGVWRRIEAGEGEYRFYKQLLVGDPVDNIVPRVGLSCPGVGERKAENYLEGCATTEDYNKTIWETYREHCLNHDNEELYHRIETTGQLLKIRQHEDEVWKYVYNYARV